MRNTMNNKDWSVADDWNSLSSENAENQPHALESFVAQQFIQEMRSKSSQGEDSDRPVLTEQEVWMEKALDAILDDDVGTDGHLKTSDADTSANGANKGDQYKERLDIHTFEDEMGREIALLVRCNQRPTELLLSQGRILPRLTDAEIHHVGQLLSWQPDMQTFVSTKFMYQAVNQIFDMYARPSASAKESNDQDAMVMDSRGVASWLNRCILPMPSQAGGSVKDAKQAPKARFVAMGPHDSRVTACISRYSTYGTGVLSRDNFQRLYYQKIMTQLKLPLGDLATIEDGVNKDEPYFLDRLQLLCASTIAEVWSDFHRHNILSPAEQEHERLLAEMRESQRLTNNEEMIMDDLLDECEIVDEQILSWSQNSKGDWEKSGKSSHELVTMAYDKKTPLYLQDGDFGKSSLLCYGT
jgi:hypothetical protein